MNVIVDTGFWYSFLGTREQVRHSVAEVVFGKLNNLDANFLVPFPTLYEAINTKLLKDKYRDKADWFLKQLQSNPHFIRIPDDEYKAKAYDLTIEKNYRGFSLVDNVIRVMAVIHIDGLPLKDVSPQLLFPTKDRAAQFYLNHKKELNFDYLKENKND